MGTKGKQVPYRVRKMDSVIEELESIQKKLPMVKEVFIQDDTLAPWRARELSKAIIDAGLDITWSCYSRGDNDFETLKIMKKAGCRNLHVGYESGSLQILRNIRKGVTPKMLENLTKNANKFGLIIHGDFIFGLPGETEKTIKNTIKWAKRLEIHSYQFATPKPYPCTPLHNWLTKRNYLEGDRIDLPNLSYEALCIWVKKAMRDCYFNPDYIKRMITKPRELMHFVGVAFSVVPHVFWERLE